MAVTADNIVRNPDYNRAHTVFDFSARDIKGQIVKLEMYKGLVCLIVNVASKSGFTEESYKLLTNLHSKYYERGLRILAFPCNQFGFEEPGTNEEIIQFAEQNHVQFDLFEKISVNGDDAHPLWKFLKSKLSLGVGKGSVIKTNFTKFLVSRNGEPQQRFGVDVPQETLEAEILKYLT